MKLICIGRNYVDHIEELKNEKPSEPVIFLKPESAITSEDLLYEIPNFSNEIQYELELVLRVEKEIKSNTENKLNNIKFLHLGVDFTARDVQTNLKNKGLPWEKSKGFDKSAIISKKYITFAKGKKINFQLFKNNNLVQNGNSENMIFNFEKILNEITKYFTCKKGDYIFTGTPSGVGKIEHNDLYEGFINEEKILTFKVN